jgi:hypothetical protein
MFFKSYSYSLLASFLCSSIFSACCLFNFFVSLFFHCSHHINRTAARVVKQPGDGSCLFHSLAYGLPPPLIPALTLRFFAYIYVNISTLMLTPIYE